LRPPPPACSKEWAGPLATAAVARRDRVIGDWQLALANAALVTL